MRPLKITAQIESDFEISFRDMVNRKIECLTEVRGIQDRMQHMV